MDSIIEADSIQNFMYAYVSDHQTTLVINWFRYKTYWPLF